eukprot:CAMPEP_0203765474 /NCGR_PEP_ID=MMETSP0098-20131031/18432_1 /ASSEMBLY_ACC=CAM_ASM_000208 /TAXON_ID=96639 /ORGANISM=" , Strain NY0313808BC1" /LENGTH=206 /DNA_ID=CAMNT_0050661731 /DNA_START=516 /DNA_END=1136 /DNA_ORIENTATION=-
MSASRRLGVVAGHLVGDGQAPCGVSASVCRSVVDEAGGNAVKISDGSLLCGGPQAHGVAFEKWHVGQIMHTKRRTITDGDIGTYCQMTGYVNENLFGDMIYLKQVGGHDRRLAPGLLTASIADALIVGSGVIENYAVAVLGITELRAVAPVYAGDTLQVFLEVVKTKGSSTKPDRGIVTTEQRVVNQNGQTVLEYTISRMLRRSEK